MLRELTIQEHAFVAGGEGGTEAGGNAIDAMNSHTYYTSNNLAIAMNSALGTDIFSGATGGNATNCPNGGSSIEVQVNGSASGLGGAIGKMLGALGINVSVTTVNCNPVTVSVPTGSSLTAAMQGLADSAGISLTELAALDAAAAANIAAGAAI